MEHARAGSSTGPTGAVAPPTTKRHALPSNRRATQACRRPYRHHPPDARAPSRPRPESLTDLLLDAWSSWPRARAPSTVLATWFDLKVFTVVAKPVEAVTPADVLGFITAQRAGLPTLPRPVPGAGACACGRHRGLGAHDPAPPVATTLTKGRKPRWLLVGRSAQR